jgi:hypothetical protein
MKALKDFLAFFVFKIPLFFHFLFFRNDYYFLFDIAQLGDTCYAASLLGPFKKKHPQARLIAFTSYGERLAKYWPYFFRIKNIKSSFDKSRYYAYMRYSKKNAHIINPHPVILAPENHAGPLLSSLLANAGILLHSGDISSITFPSVPVLEKSTLPAIQEKTIIVNLASSTLSIPTLMDAVGRTLEQAVAQGYSVRFNCPKNGMPYMFEGQDCALPTDLDQLYNLCQSGKVACFVSVRSGICDFLVSSGCPIFCIYPDDSFGAKLQKYQSLAFWGCPALVEEKTFQKDLAGELESFISQIAAK